jgi:HK97 family phage prohead protease
MEADFSGYATKNGLKCSDGRTIMPDAFAHMDTQKVPLVWQHQHNDPTNILGHAILEHRSDGVYAYGFFGATPNAGVAKELVKHGDIDSMSIFANNLTERNKNVTHGDIREVSLVLSGANPGAKIEHVSLVHGDNIESVADEAVIYTGLELSHSDLDPEANRGEDLEHAETNKGANVADTATKDRTVQDVFNEFTDEQKDVVYLMIGQAVDDAEGSSSAAKHSEVDEDSSIQEVMDSLNERQQEVVHYMIGEALQHSSITHSDAAGDTLQHSQEDNNMNRNVFEQGGSLTGSATETKRPKLTHGQLKTLVEDAQKMGSFKEAWLAHAGDYGIDDIEILFPDAQTLSNSPEIIGRRTEWVADVINGTRHSPFARIKSVAADLTADEARAKGYVKGNLKKDEIIKLLKRVTTPTTIYKKQKLDRDDIVDITSLDVVAWLKAEMRLMLDEELARAILIGDGREAGDDDAIDTDHIRPIADDVDMYAHQITVGSDLAPSAIVESVLRARTYYKGTGTPVFYTTDGILTDLILLTDKVGRRLYETEAALSAALRVSKIVTVEVMADRPDLVGIVVNLADYTIGADAGGAVSMFDDFDIDYNQYKYLIETRVSGALTKPKSAIVIKRTVGTVVTPQTPSYNGATHVLSIPAQPGVVYEIDGSSVTGNVTIEETTDVEARPATGYSFPANTNRDWTYVYTA